jgi:hypothetical protein
MNPVHPESIRDRRARAHCRSEKGEGKLKAIIVLAVLLMAVYSAVKIVPAYVKEYQLQDKMQEQARFGVVNRYPEEKIREIIFKEVQDQGLEDRIKREDIKIVANTGIVKIAIDYTVPVDLLVYHFDLHFTPSSENKALF